MVAQAYKFSSAGTWKDETGAFEITASLGYIARMEISSEKKKAFKLTIKLGHIKQTGSKRQLPIYYSAKLALILLFFSS